MTSINKLESSGTPVPDRIHVLNQWRWAPAPKTATSR
jgi:hypothetical protein